MAGSVVLSASSPVPDTILFARRREDTGGLSVVFRDRWITSGVAEYDGSRPLRGRWAFHSLPDGRGSESHPPHLRLLEAVLQEAYGSEKDRGIQRGRLSSDPFWADFVKEVERAWSVADVMMT